MSAMLATMHLSVILPARDEAEGLTRLLPALLECCPGAEVIVVDDGSTDATAEVCAGYPVRLLRHPYPKGNGAAVKTGVRAASRPWLLLMDADYQHDPSDIARMLEHQARGYDMVVGARDRSAQSSVARWLGNGFFNALASWMVGQRVVDLTSGLRLVETAKFRRFLYLLPNGFSYPTTITMAFFRAGYSVGYLPIATRKAVGASHVNLLADGGKFVMLIFRIGSLYSPLKLFLPVSIGFLLIGLGYYGYTYFTVHRFTNMGALLLSISVLVFLLGIISEQVSALNYREREDGPD